MKRPVFIALLASLLMFQSLWNVAAAFCAHETELNHQNLSHHFGHHADAWSASELGPQSEQSTEKNLKTPHLQVASVLIDHHDHLPSCLHSIVMNITLYAKEPMSTGRLIEDSYHWANFYQSPHLYALTPPPTLTPL